MFQLFEFYSEVEQIISKKKKKAAKKDSDDESEAAVDFEVRSDSRSVLWVWGL